MFGWTHTQDVFELVLSGSLWRLLYHHHSMLEIKKLDWRTQMVYNKIFMNAGTISEINFNSEREDTVVQYWKMMSFYATLQTVNTNFNV